MKTNLKLSQKVSTSLTDCSNVQKSTGKTNYIKATCTKSNGKFNTSELNLNLWFGNNDGQLTKGTNFSNSCDKENIKILTQTVTQYKRVDDYQYLRYTSEK